MDKVNENVTNILNKVEYEKFEDLKSLDDIYDYENLFNQILNYISDESNWLNQFESINNLRRVNKFDQDSFNKIFPQVVNQVTKLTASIRSNLSKISLILLKEVFNNQYYSKEVLENLKILISSVLVQSVTMKSFVKEEALACLDNLANNMIFYMPHTIVILVVEIGNKSLPSSENSFNTVIKLLNNWSREDIFSGTNNQQWENIFNHLINVYSLKREPYLKRACRVIDTIYEKFGEEDFNSLTENLNIKNLLNSMIKEADSKKTNNQKTSLRDFINKNKK